MENQTTEVLKPASLDSERWSLPEVAAWIIWRSKERVASVLQRSSPKSVTFKFSTLSMRPRAQVSRNATRRRRLAFPSSAGGTLGATEARPAAHDRRKGRRGNLE